MTRLFSPTQRSCRRAAALHALAGGIVLLCAQASAQEPDLPASTLGTIAAAEPVEAELLGETLLESAAVEADGLDAAMPVIPLTEGGSGASERAAGRWHVAPHLDLRTTFDDNIFIQHEHETADVIFTVAPGVSAGWWSEEEAAERFLDREGFAPFVEPARGNFFFADYTAILLGFAKTQSENSLDHDARLAGQWQGEKLTLGARANFELRNETNIDVGDRVRRRTVSAELSARYEVTEKTAVEAGAFVASHDHEDYLRSTEWRAESFLKYAASPMLRASFGLAVGQAEVEGGASRTFERLLARGGYALSEKLTAEVRGGVEFRQSDGEIGDRTTPIFEVDLTWEPAAGTRVGLEAYRRVETSALQPDQDFTAMGVTLRLRREVRAGVHLSLAGGYRHAEYTALAGESGRTDRTFFVRPGVLWHFARWGSAELSYEHRENNSSRRETSFENNQVSAQVSVAY